MDASTRMPGSCHQAPWEITHPGHLMFLSAVSAVATGLTGRQVQFHAFQSPGILWIFGISVSGWPSGLSDNDQLSPND